MNRFPIILCVCMLLLAGLGIGGCADGGRTPAEPGAPTMGVAQAAEDVPPRSADPRYTFVHMADDSLWQRIADGDGTAVVGLKASGAGRGFYKGKALVTEVERSAVLRSVSAQPGIEILEKLDPLPAVRLRIASADALRTLRHLPSVDYVEPNVTKRALHLSDSDFGCSYDIWSGTQIYSGSGDVMPWLYKRVGVDLAWNRSTGAGKTIGLVDTGIYVSSHQMVSNFGVGAARTAQYLPSPSFSDGLISNGACSHGTRMAGIMAAPRDGTGPVGVAWGANLVSVRHNDDVIVYQATNFAVYDAVMGIRAAAERGNIIAMAWGTVDHFSTVEAEIERWYYSHNRLFIGAAGTTAGCNLAYDAWQFVNGVLYPARLEEVMAVTAVESWETTEGTVACDAHSGSQVELVAPYGYPTAGRYQDVVAMRGSSSATALISGVAALVWSQNPGFTQTQVRQRLRESGSRYPYRDSRRGYGLVNAMKALGGMYEIDLSGCRSDGCEHLYSLSECTDVGFHVTPVGGDGPYSYQWSNGATTPSTTMRLCPWPGELARYSIAVTVQDPDPLGVTTIYRLVSIQVRDPDHPCPTCPV